MSSLTSRDNYKTRGSSSLYSPSMQNPTPTIRNTSSPAMMINPSLRNSPMKPDSFPLGNSPTLHDYYNAQNAVANESLDSTRRMMTMVEESREAGTKTMSMLDTQGEKIDRIETGMDKINTDLQEIDEDLNTLDNCCGCWSPCKKRKFEKTAAYKSTWKNQETDPILNMQPQFSTGIGRTSTVGIGHNTSSGGQGGYITRFTNDAREDEMDQNIGHVSSAVKELRGIAVDMGSELTVQNAQIDSINLKALSNKDRTKMANERLMKHLN